MVQQITCRECTAYPCGLFHCLTAPQLARLVKSRVAHAYAPGKPVFYEGNPAFAVYCVLQGTVKIWRSGSNGDEHVIRTRGKGDLVGARAVLAGGNYPVTAEPLETFVACTIPSEAFLELVRENQELAHRLLKKLAVETIETEGLILSRSMDHVRQRTARLLLKLVGTRLRIVPGPVQIKLPWRREVMAELAGTTPETLSRTLHAFVAEGIIEVERQDVRIVNMKALEKAAR